MWCSTSIICSLWARTRRVKPGSGENDAAGRSADTRMRSGNALGVLMAGMLVLEAAAAPAAQETSNDTVPPPPPPPGFDAHRPLDREDYLRKNERGYFTGLPLANYDPNTG